MKNFRKKQLVDVFCIHVLSMLFQWHVYSYKLQNTDDDAE